MRPRDDVLRSTRWASLAIVAILLPAVVVLWGLPGRTPDLWSWTIRPDMTAIFMGAGEPLVPGRLLLETFLVATVLLAAGTARAWDDLITARAGSWLYVGGLAAMALAIGALYVRMSSTASAPVRAAS